MQFPYGLGEGQACNVCMERNVWQIPESFKTKLHKLHKLQCWECCDEQVVPATAETRLRRGTSTQEIKEAQTSLALNETNETQGKDGKRREKTGKDGKRWERDICRICPDQTEDRINMTRIPGSHRITEVVLILFKHVQPMPRLSVFTPV